MDVKKKRCGHCRKHALILIECSMCHKEFCIYDRAPETHLCQNMDCYKQRSYLPLEKIMTPKIEYI